MSQKKAKQQRRMIKRAFENGFISVVYDSDYDASDDLCRLCGGGFVSLMDRRTAEYYKKLK